MLLHFVPVPFPQRTRKKRDLLRHRYWRIVSLCWRACATPFRISGLPEWPAVAPHLLSWLDCKQSTSASPRVSQGWCQSQSSCCWIKNSVWSRSSRVPLGFSVDGVVFHLTIILTGTTMEVPRVAADGLQAKVKPPAVQFSSTAP